MAATTEPESEALLREAVEEEERWLQRAALARHEADALRGTLEALRAELTDTYESIAMLQGGREPADWTQREQELSEAAELRSQRLGAATALLREVRLEADALNWQLHMLLPPESAAKRLPKELIEESVRRLNADTRVEREKKLIADQQQLLAREQPTAQLHGVVLSQHLKRVYEDAIRKQITSREKLAAQYELERGGTRRLGKVEQAAQVQRLTSRPKAKPKPSAAEPPPAPDPLNRTAKYAAKSAAKSRPASATAVLKRAQRPPTVPEGSEAAEAGAEAGKVSAEADARRAAAVRVQAMHRGRVVRAGMEAQRFAGEDGGAVFSIVVPEGSREGSEIGVALPDGSSFVVEVPAGYGPGDAFEALLPNE